MAYDNLCMYCFEDMKGQAVCPHCGRDSRAAVPQVQMLPGTLVYRDRFLIGRALGQDASGIVYAAYDTKKDNRLRIREYLPRDCAERLNDGAVVPVAGMEDQFEAGLRKLRASVESVEDPRKRHFFFEENGTAYIAQRKPVAQEDVYEDEDDAPRGGGRRVLLFAGVAVAVLVVAAVLLITVFNGALPTSRDITQSPTLDPSMVWIPEATPTATPYVAPTFAALVDPELTWMEYSYEGDVEEEYQEQVRRSTTPTPTPTASPTPRPTEEGTRYSLISTGSSASRVRKLQQRLAELGWLEDDQITGDYDADTRQAVRDFQRYINQRYTPAQKLTVDGEAGPKTQQWLFEAEVERPTPSPTPKVTPKPEDGTVDEDSPAADIREMQKKLIALGLLPKSAADGKYGATTVAAVRRFQKRVNELSGYEVLDVTGRMDAQSAAFLDYYVEEWARLKEATAEPTATPKPTAVPTATPTTRPAEPIDGVIDARSDREDIEMVQRLLIDIGMLPAGSADGVYGSATISAVADFQQWVNDQRDEQTLNVNGTVDQLTLLYLQYCVDHGFAPHGTPTPRPTAKPTATPEPTVEPIAPVDEPEEGEEEQEITIGPRSDRESIRYVQEMLSAIGAMDPKGVDGVYGRGTERAVERFQRWVNSIQGEGTLPVTGQVDNRTRIALEYAYDHDLRMEQATEAPTEAPTEIPTEIPTEEPTEAPTEPPVEEIEEAPEEITVGEDSDPESIRYVQQMLGAVGVLDADDVTGVYDSATVEAVKRFQRWVNSVQGDGTLPVTGQVDDRTRVALEYAYDHDLRYGQSGETQEEEDEIEPEGDVAEISAPNIVIAGVAGGDGPIVVGDKRFKISWAAEGDVEKYHVTITDEYGDAIADRTTDQTGTSLRASDMEPDMLYTLTVEALPMGGTAADVTRSSAQFTRAERGATTPEPEPTPEPTEVPTPAPQVATIGKPVINVGGTAYQRDGISYMMDSTIIISWNADGDVESYSVYVENEAGEQQSLGTTTGTSKTVSTENLPAGVYTIYVGAMPAGGDRDDIQWGSTRFGIPSPTSAPGDGSTGAIDASTDAETIKQLQMRLYSLGLLSTDGLEAGVLDAQTLQAVARFQEENGLEVLDLTAEKAVVDAATVRAIFG